MTKIIPKNVRHKLATCKNRGWKKKERKQCPLIGCNGVTKKVDWHNRYYECSECENLFIGQFVSYLKLIEGE